MFERRDKMKLQKNNKKKSSASQKIRTVIIIIAIFGIIISGSAMFSILYSTYVSKNEYNKIADLYEAQDIGLSSPEKKSSTDASTDTIAPDNDGKTENSSEQNNSAADEKSWNTLLEINDDIIGYIKIPESKISYPVVQKDNSYYLTHNIYKKREKHGVPFLDENNEISPLSRHLIIYGHNMRDGTMFADLINYKKQSFYEEHPIIIFNTLYNNYQWEIFSAYKISNTNKDYTTVRSYFLDFTDLSRTEYEKIIDGWIAESSILTGIVPSADDIILTLSTCTNVDDNERFVVHARMILN